MTGALEGVGRNYFKPKSYFTVAIGKTYYVMSADHVYIIEKEINSCFAINGHIYKHYLNKSVQYFLIQRSTCTAAKFGKDAFQILFNFILFVTVEWIAYL